MNTRNQDIKQLREQGKTLQEIGNEYQISRERVRQVLKQLKVPFIKNKKPRKTIEEIRIRNRRYYKGYYKQIRLDTLKVYGGKCVCCGEKEPTFLCIDHINGGGLKHRREIRTNNLTYWLKINNYPKGFQVLCYNCNNAKISGNCPHKLTK